MRRGRVGGRRENRRSWAVQKVSVVGLSDLKLTVSAYQFCGLDHGDLPEVGAEEAYPEEGCLLGEGGESRLDDVGGLVFAL